jgi:hypothetical protein
MRRTRVAIEQLRRTLPRAPPPPPSGRIQAQGKLPAAGVGFTAPVRALASALQTVRLACARNGCICVYTHVSGCGVTELTGGMHCTYPCIWVALVVPQVGLRLAEWLLTPRVAVVWLSCSSCFLLS